MKNLLLLTLALLFPVATLAQNAPFGRQRSTITISMDGLSCTTFLGAGIYPATAWSFTATDNFNPSGTSGTGSGKIVSSLSITKQSDSCTASLFEASTEGKAFSHVIITEQDGRGQTIKVTLSDVLISTYQLQGERTEPRPSEQITFAFEKLQIAFSS